jgi:diketogulonate reductase-like aldo/keto reductase
LGPALADCGTDQVLYNLEARGGEFDLLPFCRARGMPVMAYSPVGQGEAGGGAMLRNMALRQVAARLGVRPAQVAIAWTLRNPGVISIPKAVQPAHVRENAAAATLRLSAEDCAALDAAFRPPRRKQGLQML